MSERRPTTYATFYDAPRYGEGVVSYPTEPPGRLTVGGGWVRLRYRFDADGDGLACVHRLADAAGAVWEARTRLDPHLFVYRLTDLGSLHWPLWERNDPERAGAVAERPLVTGLEVVEDDRFYRRFWLDDVLVEGVFKYQGLTVDVGHHDDYRAAVRVSGLFGAWNHVPLDADGGVPVWRGGAVRPPHDGLHAEGPIEFEGDETPGGDSEALAPIVYSLDLVAFLFRDDAAFPRPIVFRRVEGERGEPGANVAFEAG